MFLFLRQILQHVLYQRKSKAFRIWLVTPVQEPLVQVHKVETNTSYPNDWIGRLSALFIQRLRFTSAVEAHQFSAFVSRSQRAVWMGQVTPKMTYFTRCYRTVLYAHSLVRFRQEKYLVKFGKTLWFGLKYRHYLFNFSYIAWTMLFTWNTYNTLGS